MKKIFSIILFSISTSGFAQTVEKSKIDTGNYYKFFQYRGITDHLRASDAIPIIIDEIIREGFTYYGIQVGQLIKLNDSTSLVLTIWYYNNPKFGFIYETGHTAQKSPDERSFLTEKKKSYSQYENNLNGKSRLIPIDSLPNNFFLLKQTCYWYQYDNKGSDFPVTKEVAISILRQDIKSYLFQLKQKK